MDDPPFEHRPFFLEGARNCIKCNYKRVFAFLSPSFFSFFRTDTWSVCEVAVFHDISTYRALSSLEEFIDWCPNIPRVRAPSLHLVPVCLFHCIPPVSSFCHAHSTLSFHLFLFSFPFFLLFLFSRTPYLTYSRGLERVAILILVLETSLTNYYYVFFAVFRIFFLFSFTLSFINKILFSDFSNDLLFQPAISLFFPSSPFNLYSSIYSLSFFASLSFDPRLFHFLSPSSSHPRSS